MDFARQQRDPKRHVVGLTFVIVLHAIVIWGLMTGLAQKAVEVIKKPISATIVEEIKKPPPPPPPPPKKIVEPPKVQAPVQPYVPPPDIPAPPPPPEAPVIQSTPTPPPEPYVIAPPPPPVVIAPPAPPPPPKPAVRRGIQKLSGDDPVYPARAQRDGTKGRVVAQLLIDENGNVTEVKIILSEPPRVFDAAVRNALSTWKFRPEGEKYIGEVEVGFSLRD